MFMYTLKLSISMNGAYSGSWSDSGKWLVVIIYIQYAKKVNRVIYMYKNKLWIQYNSCYFLFLQTT